MGVASRDSGDLEPSPAGHRNWESIVWALERANASLRGGQCLFERCHAFWSKPCHGLILFLR